MRQQAGTNGSVVEIDSIDPNDPASISIDPATGAVLIAGTLSLGTGADPIEVSAVELPSPVRRGAQMTLFDQRIGSSGLDFDGDGREDTVDLAAWRRVVGNESVSLPHLTAAVTALRVDTFSRQATWYLPGVGVVREATFGTEGRTWDDEDLLLGYDGVSQGFGYVVQEAIGPPRSAAGGLVTSAVKSDGGVLAYAGGYTLHLDRSGHLLSRSTLPMWMRRYTSAPSASAQEIVLQALDGDGQRVAAELRLPVVDQYRPGSLRQAVRPDGGVAGTWQEFDTSARTRNRWVTVDADGVLAADFGVGSLTTETLPVSQPLWAPVLSPTRAWAAWTGPDATGAPGRPHLIDVTAGPPVPADATSLQAAALVALGASDETDARRTWSADGSRLFTLGAGSGDIAPGVASPQPWVRFTELDLSGSAGAANAPKRADYRIPLRAQNFEPAPIVFDDRVLLLTDNGDGFQPTVVWRR